MRVYDVVTSSKALYLLTQPKTVDWETHLLRFDLARGSYEGVRLPFSGTFKKPSPQLLPLPLRSGW